MINRKELKGKIKETGFSCRMCGECCIQVSENSNLVMVNAPEIRKIMEGTGLSWEEVAEPYPEILETDTGESFTFGWCLKRKGDRCRFLDENCRCSIYEFRPLICRTYPFMLDGPELLVFECPGAGVPVEDREAEEIAGELIRRADFECEEFGKIRRIFSSARLSGEKMNIIDSEGVKTVG
jgi:hypothetical protein